MIKLDFQDNLNFAASGVFTSDWFDTSSSGLIVNWLEESVTSNVPTDSSVTVEYRSSNTQDENEPWVSSAKNLTGRYIQVKATLQKTAEAETPSIESITLTPEAKNFEETINLVQNPSFENWTGSTPNNWSKTVNVTTEQVTGYWGGSAARFSASNGGNNGQNRLYQISVVEPSTQYTVSFKVRSVLGIGKLNFGIDGTGGSLAFFNGANKDWQTVSGTFTTSSGAVTAVYFWPDTAGDIFDIDCVQVEKRAYATPFVDGIRQAGKGVMIEEGTTNKFLHSEDFTQAEWVKSRITVSSAANVGPDHSLSATKITEDTQLGSHYIFKSNSLFSVQAGSISIYAKPAGRDWLCISFGGNNQAWFNIQLGTIGTVAAGYSATIEDMGNGWYRCSASTSAVPLIGTDTQAIFILGAGDNTVTYQGDGSSGIYIWGAQAEQKPYPTSYIKTNGATATRNGENITIPDEAINPSIGSVVLRFFADEKIYNTSTALFLFSYGISFSLNQFRLYKETNKSLRWSSSDADGTTTTYSTSKFLNERKWYTIGATWDIEKATIWCDGEKVGEVLNPHLPDDSVSHVINLGKYSSDAYQANTIFSDLDIFHEVLSDEEMAEYTSTSGVIALTEKHSYKLDFNNADFVHSEGGYRITPAYDLDALETISSSEIMWGSNQPANSYIDVETSIDNGETWNYAASSGAISGLIEDLDATDKTLLIKQKFRATKGAVPSISDLTYKVGQKFNNVAETYIKPLFNKLVLTPTNVWKWQLENKKYKTSWVDGTRQKDSLTISNGGELMNAANSTIVARAYFNSKIFETTTDSLVLFDCSAGGNINRFLIYKAANTPGFRALIGEPNAWTDIASTNVTPAEGWHTVGMRWENVTNRLSLWIDGVKVGDVGITNFPTSVNDTLFIGQSHVSTAQWNQPIDEVHIFGEALTDAEMELYTQASGSIQTITDKHTYRLQFNGGMKYGCTGTWTSRWLDAGANCIDTPWIELETVESTPDETSINYKFRCSNTGSDDDATDWYDDITDENLIGRYIQVKAFLSSDNAENVTPNISYIECVAKFS